MRVPGGGFTLKFESKYQRRVGGTSKPAREINATLVSQRMNPLLIERKDTFLVVINYDYYSQPYTRSVMFLNRQNAQVRFQLTCYRNAFRNLQKAFQNSHCSWQNL